MPDLIKKRQEMTDSGTGDVTPVNVPAPTPIPPASSQAAGRAAAQAAASDPNKHATQAGKETSDETNKKMGWGDYAEPTPTPESTPDYSGYSEPTPSAEDLAAENADSYEYNQAGETPTVKADVADDTVEVAVEPEKQEETSSQVSKGKEDATAMGGVDATKMAEDAVMQGRRDARYYPDYTDFYGGLEIDGTSPDRNELDENGMHIFKGYEDDEGNYVSGFDEWYSSNKAGLTEIIDFATDGQFHTGDEVYAHQKLAANLAYDYQTMADYWQGRIDEAKEFVDSAHADFDAFNFDQYGEAGEEAKATWQQELDTLDAQYASMVEGLGIIQEHGEAAKECYDLMVENNKAFAQYDDDKLLTQEQIDQQVLDAAKSANVATAFTDEEIADFTKLTDEQWDALIESGEESYDKRQFKAPPIPIFSTEATREEQRLADLQIMRQAIQGARDAAQYKNDEIMFGRKYIGQDNTIAAWDAAEAALEANAPTADSTPEEKAAYNHERRYIQERIDACEYKAFVDEYADVSDSDIRQELFEMRFGNGETTTEDSADTNDTAHNLLTAKSAYDAAEEAFNEIAETARPTSAEYLDAYQAMKEAEAAYAEALQLAKDESKLDVGEIFDFSAFADILSGAPEENELSAEEQKRAEYLQRLLQDREISAIQEEIKSYEKDYPDGTAMRHWAEDIELDVEKKEAALLDAQTEAGKLDAEAYQYATVDAHSTENHTPEEAAQKAQEAKDAHNRALIAEQELAEAKGKLALVQALNQTSIRSEADYAEQVAKGKEMAGDIAQYKEAIDTAMDVGLDRKPAVDALVTQFGLTQEDAEKYVDMYFTLDEKERAVLFPNVDGVEEEEQGWLGKWWDKVTRSPYLGEKEVGKFTDEELNDFYYHLAKEGASAAAQYAMGVNNAYRNEYNDLAKERFMQLQNYRAGHNGKFQTAVEAAMMPVGNFALNLTALPEAISNFIQAEKLGMSVAPTDPTNSQLAEWAQESSSRQVTAMLPNFKPAEFLYNTYNSIVNSALSLATFSALGSALGLTDDIVIGGKGALQAFVSAATDLEFFGSAAASRYRELLEQGVDPQKAGWASVYSGLAEAMFEHFSIENLYHAKGVADWHNALDWAWHTACSAGVEGSEELFTNWANRLGDALYLKEDNPFNDSVDAYIAQGFEEDQALRFAMHDLLKEDALSFLGGAISGGVNAGSSSMMEWQIDKNKLADFRASQGKNFNIDLPNGKKASQELGTYLWNHEFIRPGDEHLFNEGQRNTVEEIKDLAWKASEGKASDEEIGRLQYLTAQFDSKVLDDFALANKDWYGRVEPMRLVQVSQEALNKLLGPENAQKYLEAVRANPHAKVENDFSLGLQQAVPNMGSNEASEVAGFLERIFTGSDRTTPEDIAKVLDSELLSSPEAQMYLWNYLKDKVPTDTPAIEVAAPAEPSGLTPSAEWAGQNVKREPSPIKPASQMETDSGTEAADREPTPIPSAEQAAENEKSREEAEAKAREEIQNPFIPIMQSIGMDPNITSENVGEALKNLLTTTWERAKEAAYQNQILKNGLSDTNRKLNDMQHEAAEQQTRDRLNRAPKGIKTDALAQYRDDSDSITFGNNTTTRKEFVEAYMKGYDPFNDKEIKGPKDEKAANRAFDRILLNSTTKDGLPLEGVKASMKNYDLSLRKAIVSDTKKGTGEPKDLERNGEPKAQEPASGKLNVQTPTDNSADMKEGTATGTEVTRNGEPDQTEPTDSKLNVQNPTDDSADMKDGTGTGTEVTRKGEPEQTEPTGGKLNVQTPADTSSDTTTGQTSVDGSELSRTEKPAEETPVEDQTTEEVAPDKAQQFLDYLQVMMQQTGEMTDEEFNALFGGATDTILDALVGREPANDFERRVIDAATREMDRRTSEDQTMAQQDEAPASAETSDFKTDDNLFATNGKEDKSWRSWDDTINNPDSNDDEIITRAEFVERAMNGVGKIKPMTFAEANDLFDDLAYIDEHDSDTNTDYGKKGSNPMYSAGGASTGASVATGSELNMKPVTYSASDVPGLVELGRTSYSPSNRTISSSDRSWGDAISNEYGKTITRAEFVAAAMSGQNLYSGTRMPTISGVAANDLFDDIVDNKIAYGGYADRTNNGYSITDATVTADMLNAPGFVGAMANTLAILEAEMRSASDTSNQKLAPFMKRVDLARKQLEGLLGRSVSDAATEVTDVRNQINTRLAEINNRLEVLMSRSDQNKIGYLVDLKEMSQLRAERQKLMTQTFRLGQAEAKYTKALDRLNSARNRMYSNDYYSYIGGKLYGGPAGTRGLTGRNNDVAQSRSGGSVTGSAGGSAQSVQGNAGTVSEQTFKTVEEILSAGGLTLRGKVLFDSAGMSPQEIANAKIPLSLRNSILHAMRNGVGRVVLTDGDLLNGKSYINEKGKEVEQTVGGFYDTLMDGGTERSVIVLHKDSFTEKNIQHEYMHHMLRKMSERQKRGFLTSAIRTMFGSRQDLFEELFDSYKIDYAIAHGRVIDENGRVDEDLAYIIYEEMVADFYAGLNRFKTPEMAEAMGPLVREMRVSLYNYCERLGLEDYARSKWINREYTPKEGTLDIRRTGRATAPYEQQFKERTESDNELAKGEHRFNPERNAYEARFSLANTMGGIYDTYGVDINTAEDSRLDELARQIDEEYEAAQKEQADIRSTWTDKDYADLTPDEYWARYHEWNEQSGIDAVKRRVDTLGSYSRAISKEKAWRAIDPEALIQKAKDIYGTTDDFRKSGYILPDGTMLDMSQGANKRTLFHHETAQEVLFALKYPASDAIEKFVGRGGAIRIDVDSDGIDIPQSGMTPAQYETLRDFLSDFIATEDYDRAAFYVSTFGKNLGTSERFNPSNTTQILNAIRQYYDTGSFPKQSTTQQFYGRYSLANTEAVSLDELQTARDEMLDLRQQLRDRKADVDEWSRRIMAGEAEIDDYNKWLSDSGYNRLYMQEREASKRYNDLNRAYDEQQESANAEAEQNAIEQSGLSEADYFGKEAVKVFGYTPYFYDAGYITPNGRMLNFSGEKGKHYGSRGQDHRSIGQIFAVTSGTEAMNRFISYGNIRIMAEAPGLDISANIEPTAEQYSRIRDFARSARDEDYFSIDITGEDGRVIDTIEYESVNPAKIVNDLKNYYRTGEVPQQSVTAQFHASFSLVGVSDDGMEVYETSQAVKDMTREERMDAFEARMANEFRGRTARFERNGHIYYAKFDSTGVSKNIYGDDKSDQSGWRAKIRAGADGDIFDLIENSTYNGSSAEKSGKKGKAHNKTQRWDYFIKKVQIDGIVYDLTANVRRKNDDFVYNIQLNRDINTKPATSYSPLPKAGFNQDIAGTDNVSQNGSTVKYSKQEHPNARYSLCAFEDGTKFVNVETDQEQFDGLTDKEKRDLAEKIIKERFSGRIIGETNKAFVNSQTAREYAYPSKRLTDSGVLDAKMRASTELDNLLEAGSNFRTAPDGADGHTHPDAVGGFTYFDTLFKVGEEFYKGLVNIKNNAKGALLVDITKIENVTKDTYNSYGKNPKFVFLNDVSNDIKSQNNPNVKNQNESEPSYSIAVSDPDTLDFLNDQLENGDVVYTYKSFLEYEDENGDPYLIAPMAGVQKDETGKKSQSHALRPGVWEESVGNPNSKSLGKKVNDKTGEVSWTYGLEKSDVDGSVVPAAYNPYQHSSDVVLNDQFSIAYKRPNLVTYMCAIPKSELTSGYHFGVTDPEKATRSDGDIVTAKDAVGMHDWKSGSLASQLENTQRHVYLSRWLMPVRKLSNIEVAQQYKEILDREAPGLGVPFNVVPSGLLSALQEVGVPIDLTGTGLSEANYRKYLSEVNAAREEAGLEPFPYSYQTKAERDAAKKERKNASKRFSISGDNLDNLDDLLMDYDLSDLGRIVSDTFGSTFETEEDEMPPELPYEQQRPRRSVENPTHNPTAYLKPETLNAWLSGRGFADTGNPNYAQAYIGWMNPEDFLYLTTSTYDYEDNRVRAEGYYGDLEDISSRAQRGREADTIHLSIDSETGRVYGHEGRHRMAYLQSLGVERVPVLFFDSGNKYDKEIMEDYTLSGEQRPGKKVTLDNPLIPLSNGYRGLVENEFVKGEEQDNDLQTARFSITDDSNADGYTLSDIDSTGRELTDEQYYYFRNSKVVDEDGHLIPLYHGTNAFGFTEIDFDKADDGISFFLTDSPEVAGSYTRNNTVRSLFDKQRQRRAIDVSKLSDEDLASLFSQVSIPYFESATVSKFEDVLRTFTGPLNAAKMRYASFFEEELLPSREDLGLTETDLAFYDALKGNSTSVESIIDLLDRADKFYYSLRKKIWDTDESYIWDEMRSLQPQLQTAASQAQRFLADHNSAGVSLEDNVFITDPGSKNFYTREQIERLTGRRQEEEELGRNSAGIYKGYANLTNPFIVDANGAEWNQIPVDQEVVDYLKALNSPEFYVSEWAEDGEVKTRGIAKYAKDHGYDGAIIRNCVDIGEYKRSYDYEAYSTPATLVLCFEQNQFKDYRNTEPTDGIDLRFSIADTYDAFGDEIDVQDGTVLNATKSTLSDQLFYSEDGNTAYYQLDSGETVVMENVGEDSPEARYINFLEATNNANSTDTTTAKPYTIPPATRYESDGYNIGESNDGLRRGAEEVPSANQEGTLRRAGSNGERNEQSQPQSEEAEGVRFSATIPTADDPNHPTAFVNQNGDVVTTAEAYPYGSMERMIIEAWNTGDFRSIEDQINEMLDIGHARDEVFDMMEEIAAQPLGLTPQERDAVYRQIEEMRVRYGTMPSANVTKRDVHFPVATDDDTKLMKGAQTHAQEAETEWLSEEIMAEALRNEILSYVPASNKSSIEKAEDYIKAKKGNYEEIARDVHAWLASGERVKPWQVAVGELLLKEVETEGRADLAMSLVIDLTLMAHETGQALQAFAILRKATPRGQLYYLQGVVNQLNKKYEKQIREGKMGKIELPQDAAQRMLACETRQELNDVVEEIKDEIAKKIPVSWADRWNAWRYLAMLGNPRTHVRNMLGNGLFRPAVFIKDVISRRLEDIASRHGKLEGRSRIAGANLKSDTEWMRYANEDYEEMYKILVGEATGNKYADANDILSRRDLWGKDKWLGGKFLAWADRKNSDLLTKEDATFLKKYYTRAFAEFLQARGVTEEDLRDKKFGATKANKKLINEARAWATIEAQRNTYRDANAVASWLNSMKRQGTVPYTILEGVVPFTKTPMNILARGIEYSPIGLIQSVRQLAKDLRSPSEMTTSQALDRLAAGMTGTMIVGLGLFLTAMGWLRGSGGDDDKKKEFEELMGHQAWSLELFGYSYTIDWMAPAALPLFIGSAIYDMLATEREEELGFEDIVKALLGIADPLSQLSMLDGISTMLSNLADAQGTEQFSVLLWTALTSYVGQGMPTLLGQVARTFDPDRRSTYIQPGSKNPMLQRFIQSSIQAKIPGWENQKMRYVDNWGRTDSANTPWEKFLKGVENFLSPGYLNKIETSAVEDELMRLYEATGDKNILPDRMGKYFQVDGERKNLTADEYEQLLTEKGQMHYNLLNEVMSSEYYASLTDEQKAKLLLNAGEFSKNYGKQMVDPEFDMDSHWMDVARAIGPADYLMIQDDLSHNRTHDQLFTYLVSNPNLSYDQIAYLIADEYAAPDKIPSVGNNGYNYEITEEDEAAMQEIFKDLVHTRLAELETDPRYVAGDEYKKGDMMDNLYNEIKEDVKTIYAEQLDASDRPMVLGKASSVGTESFNMVLDLTRNEIEGEYRDDIAAQAGWLSQKYRADSQISNPDRDGWDIKLSADDKDELYDEFQKAWEPAYRKMLTEDPEFRNATSRAYQDKMIASLFNEVSQQVEDAYASKLYKSGKADEVIGDPKGTAKKDWLKNYEIANEAYTNPKDQAAWLAKRFTGATTLDNPDRPGYNIKTSDAQQAQLAQIEQDRFTAEYEAMKKDPKFKSMTPEEQAIQTYQLAQNIMDVEEAKYSRYLLDRGAKIEQAIDTQCTNSEYFNMVFSEDLTDSERYDLIEQRYDRYVGKSILNNSLDYLQQHQRVGYYMDYVRENMYKVAGLTGAEEAEAYIKKIHEPAMKASGNAIKADYNLAKTTAEADDAAKIAAGYNYGMHLGTDLNTVAPNTTPAEASVRPRNGYVIPPAATENTPETKQRTNSGLVIPTANEAVQDAFKYRRFW